MLVRFTELVHTVGFYDGEQREIARETSAIDGIDAAELDGYEGDCCMIKTTCDDEPLAVIGNLDSVMAVLQAVEYSAAEKLDAIRGILSED